MAETGSEGGKPQAGTALIERSNHVFDPWLRTDSPYIASLAANVGLSFYDHAGPRKRAVKQRDRDNVARITEAVLTNIAFAVAAGYEPPSIAVSLGASKRVQSRYDPHGFAFMPKVLEVLSGYEGGRYTFTLHKSAQRGISSFILPGPSVFPSVKGVSPERIFPIEKFYQEPGAETIILTRTERDYVQNTRTRELIDYKEDEASPSIRFRQEVERINAYLASAEMGITADGGPRIATGCRRLQRFFSLLEDDRADQPRFDQGGRLFGGWWQGLPKSRRPSIRLAGEPIADLDFSNMFLRLAYLDAGLEPPPGDLYGNVRGLHDPRWRDGVKTVTNAMLFRSSPLVRLPKGVNAGADIPGSLKGSQVREAILAAHPLLTGTFETGAGFRLMFQESQILISALLRMIDAGIPALPMHDGCMVPQSRQAEAAECMATASLGITGHRLPIALKTFGDYRP